MKTSQKNTGLTPEQIKAWFALEGFSLWREDLTWRTWWAIRRGGDTSWAVCRSIYTSADDGEDRWEYLSGMSIKGEREVSMDELQDSEWEAAYVVAAVASEFSYAVEVDGYGEPK